MKSEHPIPKGATHFLFWWDGIHFFKRDQDKSWHIWLRGEWMVAEFFTIKWFFGWRLSTKYSSIVHKLRKV